MSKLSPTERRLEGVQQTSESFFDANADYALLVTDSESQVKAAAEIRKLADMGRTAGWKLAVETWAVRVERASDLKALRHAILQGSINTAHAA